MPVSRRLDVAQCLVTSFGFGYAEGTFMVQLSKLLLRPGFEIKLELSLGVAPTSGYQRE